MNSAFGKWLYLRSGFSVNFMMPSGYGNKAMLSKAVHAHFKNALPDAGSRAATFACVQEIKNAGPFWNAQWAKVDRLRPIPTLLCWGLKDRFFPPDLLERWKQALPQATVRPSPRPGTSCMKKRTKKIGGRCVTILMRSVPETSRSQQAVRGYFNAHAQTCLFASSFAQRSPRA
ncbi:MAG: hypothetical protein IPF41_12275 [Flavobacteriales bacterium]|nr:hypothetical protein [Flavobacteriales bacterium]